MLALVYLADKTLDQCSSTEIDFSPRFRPRNVFLKPFFMTPTDYLEIHKIKIALRDDSAPGILGCTAAFIKAFRYFILQPFTFICNTCLPPGCFLQSWKLDVVIPIHKVMYTFKELILLLHLNLTSVILEVSEVVTVKVRNNLDLSE